MRHCLSSPRTFCKSGRAAYRCVAYGRMHATRSSSPLPVLIVPDMACHLVRPALPGTTRPDSGQFGSNCLKLAVWHRRHTARFCRRSVFCTVEGKTAILPGMETPEALQQCVRREPPMIARLRLAMTRLADAERERSWALVAAKEAGLSIRQIARATGVSPPRRLSRWEEWAASRQALGLPPYERS